jgi:hypothetical protein
MAGGACGDGAPSGEPAELTWNGHRYWKVSSELDWTSAASFCEGSGGYLVDLEEPGENEEVTRGLGIGPGRRWYWSGAHRFSRDEIPWDGWNWSRGLDVYEPTFWRFGEPGIGQECGALGPGGLWDGFPCDKTLPFVCESPGWRTNSDGHSYRSFLRRVTWNEAVRHCHHLGGHLLTITNNTGELRFAFYDYGSAMWLGGIDADGKGFVWEDGEPFEFRNIPAVSPGWTPGVRHCVALHGDGRFWSRDCSTAMGYICEREPARP